jgi:hypothetical protein
MITEPLDGSGWSVARRGEGKDFVCGVGDIDVEAIPGIMRRGISEGNRPPKWREGRLFSSSNVGGWSDGFVLVSHGSFRDVD